MKSAMRVFRNVFEVAAEIASFAFVFKGMYQEAIFCMCLHIGSVARSTRNELREDIAGMCTDENSDWYESKEENNANP
jgi:hypothetical protein